MWIARHDGSIEQPPTPEQVQQRQQRMSPPDNEFPAGIGRTVLLGRSDDAAVGITQIEAFSTGFRFTLAVRLRRERPELAFGGLTMLISPRVHPGTTIAMADRLLLGIEYADGRRASTLQDMRMHGPDGTTGGEQLVLVQQGGGGGQRSADQTYWVTPLPPDATVDVVLAWPGFGIPESRATLDAAAIRTAASRSQILWPPLPPAQQPPPLEPRPSSGWFAEP